ncbi:MAG: hypothetical protein AAF939_09365 [Planctomycetota bacterium]
MKPDVIGFSFEAMRQFFAVAIFVWLLVGCGDLSPAQSLDANGSESGNDLKSLLQNLKNGKAKLSAEQINEVEKNLAPYFDIVSAEKRRQLNQLANQMTSWTKEFEKVNSDQKITTTELEQLERLTPDLLTSQSNVPEEGWAKYQNAFLVLKGDRPIDGPTALTILFIGSALLHFLAAQTLAIVVSFFPKIADVSQLSLESKENGLTEKKVIFYRRFVYFVAAIFFSVLILVYVAHLNLLSALGFKIPDVNFWGGFRIVSGDLDLLVTGMIMVVGSEKIAQWLQLPGTPAPVEVQPVVISGEIDIKDPPNDDDGSQKESGPIVKP